MRYTIEDSVLTEILSELPEGQRLGVIKGHGALTHLISALVWRIMDLHTALHLDQHEAIGYLDAIRDLEAGASLDDLRRNADERLSKCVERDRPEHRKG